MRVKYPRTYHLPWSPGVMSDDKVIKSLDHLSKHEIVITEKMDGENTTLYTQGLHARSLDSRHHPSRDWVKQFHSQIGHLIPEKWRVCGENLYARHSIAYHDLLSYFYGFSIWNEHNFSLGWDDTLEWFELLNIVPVRELYRGQFDIEKIHEVVSQLDLTKQEGVVIRSTSTISYDDFSKLACKWVRPAHVQTDVHWSHQAIISNQLKGV